MVGMTAHPEHSQYPLVETDSITFRCILLFYLMNMPFLKYELMETSSVLHEGMRQIRQMKKHKQDVMVLLMLLKVCKLIPKDITFALHLLIFYCLHQCLFNFQVTQFKLSTEQAPIQLQWLRLQVTTTTDSPHSESKTIGSCQ